MEAYSEGIAREPDRSFRGGKEAMESLQKEEIYLP